MIDLARYQDPLTIQRVLHTASTIAIVGLSGNELRASYFVGYYLRRHGYRVIPVNPRESEILGEVCYPSLLDVPVPVDVVNVFRAPDALPGIAREAVAIRAGALWCQFGVINAEGARIAEDGETAGAAQTGVERTAGGRLEEGGEVVVTEVVGHAGSCEAAAHRSPMIFSQSPLEG